MWKAPARAQILGRLVVDPEGEVDRSEVVASVAAARALREPCPGVPEAGDQGVRSIIRRSGAAARLMPPPMITKILGSKARVIEGAIEPGGF
jgi:hypothetical protein